MAGRGLMQRIADLERGDEPGFSGYASIYVFEGQTVEQAKAEWIAENGPVGGRVVVLWNMGGLSNAAA